MNWRVNQQLYSAMNDKAHSDNIADGDVKIESVSKYEHAKYYMENKTFPMYQPAKTRVVAILYAYLIAQLYGENFYETLQNESLLTDDPFFEPYHIDRYGYDEIIENLGWPDKWPMLGSWNEYTLRYFYLECTDEGVQEALSRTHEQIAEFVENGGFPISITPREQLPDHLFIKPVGI